MKSFKELMNGQLILPIIQADSIEHSVAIATAMSEGGIHLVEVVLRSASSLESLKAIKTALPDLIVGAGTVIDEPTLHSALDAGADYIVTPAVSNQLLTQLKDCKVPVLPGVSNTADILLAREFGYKELKLFPASLCGGAKFISAISTVFSDIVFCPTGGVTQDNRADYLTQNNCFAVGGTWVVKSQWVDEGNWRLISDACQLANQAC